jgi:hypothetical protein
MKLFTTLALLLLLGAGLLVWFSGGQLPPGWSDEPVISTSESEAGQLELLPGVTAKNIRKLTVQQRGETLVVLDRGQGNTWTVSGNWPASPAEVQATLSVFDTLRSRFKPLTTTADSLQQTGLARPALQVEIVTEAGKTHRLHLGEPAGEYRFVQPTFARVDEESRILRLAPGLVGRLARPAEQYRQRRLFPSERVSRRSNPQERIDRLDARELILSERDNPTIHLVRGAEGWAMTKPTRDRLDPDAAERLLAAVADLWAEQFVTDSKAITGLDKPERRITVVRNDGTRVTLAIGLRSRSEAPPPSIPGSPPPPIPDSYRYAQLEGYPLVFEIQDGKFNDLFVNWQTLRDARLARFNSEDAEKIEILQGGKSVVLQRQGKETWQMLQPRDVPADNDKVKELLTKVSGLEPTDRDLFGGGRPAALAAAALGGLSKPGLAGLALLGATQLADRALGLQSPVAQVILTLREKARPEDRDRSQPRTIALRLGKPDASSKRTYLQVDGWPRVDADDGSLLELLNEAGLAYRSKQPLDFTAGQLQQLEIRRVDTLALGGALGLMAQLDRVVQAAQTTSRIVLDHQGSDWRLLAPLSSLADSGRAAELGNALGRLKVLAHVADDVPADRLAEYGLAQPTLQIRWSFLDAEKPPRTLSIGRSRGEQPGYFARLDESRDVLAVPDDLVEQLRRPVLSYLPASLWQVAFDDDIDRFRIRRADQPDYQIVRTGDNWEVVGPFKVTAPSSVVEQLRNALQSPRAEEYRSADDQGVEQYGLAKPALQVTAVTRQGKEYTLWLGNPTGEKGGRFARLPSRPGVFVVNETLAKAVDQSPLDFLDRTLLRFEAESATALLRESDKKVLQLVKSGEGWQIAQPEKAEADEVKVPQLIRLLSELRAERLVAYQPKDLSPYGLQSPEARLTITLQGQPSRVLLLGKKVDGEGRYVTVEGSPVVGVLAANTARQLLVGPLAFRDHRLARVPDADLIKLTQGTRKITFARPEGSWKVTEPLQAEADHEALENFFNTLSRFRADEFVEEKPSPQALKEYGLDRPVARWEVFNLDEPKLDLSIGGKEKNGSRRYARLAGRDLVFLLDDKASTQAVAEYRPRTVFKQPIDPAQIETVRFGFRDKPQQYRKRGNDWENADQPDAKVNSAALNEALSVLRELKLERYVRDNKADFKLFGLEPPELVLEVTTPTTKATLHLGGLEGDSKRRYARVPGSDAVFVLDEATSDKLFLKRADGNP